MDFYSSIKFPGIILKYFHADFISTFCLPPTEANTTNDLHKIYRLETTSWYFIIPRDIKISRHFTGSLPAPTAGECLGGGDSQTLVCLK
jgi:hypothetical protein